MNIEIGDKVSVKTKGTGLGLLGEPVRIATVLRVFQNRNKKINAIEVEVRCGRLGLMRRAVVPIEKITKIHTRGKDD